MFTGLCWNPAATNAVTASTTGMYLPMIVRPMVAKNAAIPTSQLARNPDTTTASHAPAPTTTASHAPAPPTSAATVLRATISPSGSCAAGEIRTNPHC